MRKQRENEERKRQAEITKLKAEAETRRVKVIEQDIETYEQIVASPYGKDMTAAVWQSLLNKYPDVKNVATGDINALKRVLIYNLPPIIEPPKDERFFAYGDGTVLDTRTNLMWAAQDNGSDIEWIEAKSYCEKYRVGGYTDWRMPTSDELEGLYDAKIKAYRSDCSANIQLTKLIRLTCSAIWSSETRDSTASFWPFKTHDPAAAIVIFDGGGGDYGILCRTATASGLSRCVSANRLFGHLVL